jgi:outer membrane protein assembly factor BamB
MVVALPTTIVMGASRIAVAGSQDGRVYAFNADSGAFLWKSAVLGAAVQASPSGLFVDFGGVANLVLVGTRAPTGDSKFYALNLGDGSEAWHFDNGGGPNGIGIITGQAQVQYPNRVYFTSRTKGGGSSNTVWCLQFTPTTVNKQWGLAYGDTDAGPVLRNNVLYVGNTTGQVRALDPIGGGSLWTGPYATGDGPVKGYIWVQQIAGSPRLFFSTNGKVHAIKDNGPATAPTAFWSTPVAVANVSPPYFLNGRVYVGGDNSRVYSIDGTVATPPGPNTVVLGDPLVSKVVGSPTIDTANQVLLVGSDQGLIYSVLLPF